MVDFQALETDSGTLLKVVSNTSPDAFSGALNLRSVVNTCGHLVSMVVANHGVDSTPLALLAVKMKTALLQMHAGDGNVTTPGQSKGGRHFTVVAMELYY